MVGVPSHMLEFSSNGQVCRGVLHLPDGDGECPAVILCTGFSGTQDTPAIQAAAATFAAAGFAAFTFDYRRFGVSDGTPRQVIDLADQRADIDAAATFVAAQPRIDPQRIALWGTSLGGGHVVVAGAQRPGIAAVIAQVPFNGFPRRVEGRSARTTIGLLAAMALDRVRGHLRLPPYYVPAVAGPNSVAVMSSAAAELAIASLDSATWRNEVAPRVLFDMMRYHPGSFAARLTAPLLVCGARNDLESPAEKVEELVAAAPNGRLIWYPIRHFDVYTPDVRAGVLADQVAFLHEVLTESSAR
jgi:alpha-beta hydrolase superfamily lysophospholipase